MSTEVDNFACEIARDLPSQDGKYSFDLSLIVIIGSIIINTLQLLIKCNVFSSNLSAKVKNPGMVEKAMLARTIKNKVPKEYMHLREEIKNTIIDKIKDLPEDKINSMITEVKNAR